MTNNPKMKMRKIIPRQIFKQSNIHSSPYLINGILKIRNPIIRVSPVPKRKNKKVSNKAAVIKKVCL